MPKEKLLAQARDELFSHINRCGVLQATQEDQSQWMDETIDYLGERYPDLVGPELQELRAVGMRFCQPAISHGSTSATQVAVEDAPEDDSAEGDILAGSDAAENTASDDDDANAA